MKFFVVTLLLFTIIIVTYAQLRGPPREGLPAPVEDNKWKSRDPLEIEQLIFGVDSRDQKNKCYHEIDLIWKSQLGSSCDTTPIIADVGNDGKKEIVIATISHYIEVLQGEDGSKVEGWPFTFANSQFQANPILYDFDKDGNSDIILSTVKGEIVFIRETGFPYYTRTLKVPPLRVDTHWFEGLDSHGVASRYSLHRQTNPNAKKTVSQAEADQILGRKLFQVESEEDQEENNDDDEQKSIPSQADAIWSGVEGWLPQEGVESLELFLPTDTPLSYILQLNNNLDPLKSNQYDKYLEENPDVERLSNSTTEALLKVYIDPHILSAPVIADIDSDGSDELIVSVSWYFDSEDYSDPNMLKSRFGRYSVLDLSKYVAGGIVIFDIQKQEVKHFIPLDLTTDTTLYRGHIYASPTIVDLNKDGNLEIIVGTAVGFIYIINSDGTINFNGWPQMMDSIYSQVIAQDINNDGEIEIIAVDINNNIVCFAIDGSEIWEARLSGIVNAPPSLEDLNDDGVLDIVVASDLGHIWGFDGISGRVLNNFPIKLGGAVYAQPTILSIADVPQIIVPAFDGKIYIIDTLTGCVDSFDLGENSYSQVLVDDLMGNGFLNLIVTTKEGNVYCFGTNIPYHPLKAVTSQSNLQFGKFDFHGLFIADRNKRDVSGKYFTLDYEIVDYRKVDTTRFYDVSVSVAGSLKTKKRFEVAGKYSETLMCPDSVVSHANVRVTMRNEFGEIFEDSVAVSCNLHFTKTLKWLLVLPFVSMALVLIFSKQLSTPLPLLGK